MEVFGLLLAETVGQKVGVMVGLQAEAVMVGLQAETVKVGPQAEAQDGHRQDPAQAAGNLEVEVTVGNQPPVYYH